jgi:hypothetical protein
MKILLKLALLTSTLLAVAPDAFARISQTYQTITTSGELYTVPGPAALGLLGIGIVVLALVRRKK